MAGQTLTVAQSETRPRKSAEENPTRRAGLDAKRLMDTILGAVALLFSLPVLGFCMLIIRLSSRGPGLLRQVRLGKDGRPFTMYKLRTMHHDAEAMTGAVWATDDDPRVIPVCRWMRRSHVDELPQLLNVLAGQMSLVGPRPERPEIADRLSEHHEDTHERLAVRPGITGLAQLRCGYDTTHEQFRHKLDADLEYIRTYCWWRDLAIIVRTVPCFLGCEKDGKAPTVAMRGDQRASR